MNAHSSRHSDGPIEEGMTWVPTIIVISICLVPAFGGVLLLASRRAVWSEELDRRREEARELTELRRRKLAGRMPVR